jgi:C-terminal processing protease CtpA/Prc
MAATTKAPTRQAAYAEISKMMSLLGDPFTRVEPPANYAESKVGFDGEVTGVGIMLAAEPGTGKLFVVRTCDGGPAVRYFAFYERNGNSPIFNAFFVALT